MNKPSRPTPPFAPASPPYELDGYGWAFAQARLLREGRFDLVDVQNLAEEIESVGKSEQRAAENNLRLVLIHQLKWRYQPERRGKSWVGSIREHLRRFDRIMAKNPSLKSQLEEIRAEAYREARFDAGEETGLGEDALPEDALRWEEIRSIPTVDDPAQH